MSFLYHFGTLGNGLPARRNRMTGVVCFVLWKAGQHGHTKDFWFRCGPGHVFTPDGATKGIKTPW